MVKLTLLDRSKYSTDHCFLIFFGLVKTVLSLFPLLGGICCVVAVCYGTTLLNKYTENFLVLVWAAVAVSLVVLTMSCMLCLHIFQDGLLYFEVLYETKKPGEPIISIPINIRLSENELTRNIPDPVQRPPVYSEDMMTEHVPDRTLQPLGYHDFHAATELLPIIDIGNEILPTVNSNGECIALVDEQLNIDEVMEEARAARCRASQERSRELENAEREIPWNCNIPVDPNDPETVK